MNWISISDRPPNSEESFLVWAKLRPDDGYFQCLIGEFEPERRAFRVWHTNGASFVQASHWMPLPAPPKESGQ